MRLGAEIHPSDSAFLNVFRRLVRTSSYLPPKSQAKTSVIPAYFSVALGEWLSVGPSSITALMTMAHLTLMAQRHAMNTKFRLPILSPFPIIQDTFMSRRKRTGQGVVGGESECVTYVFQRKKRAGRKWMLR